jgi:hypothetical protein
MKIAQISMCSFSLIALALIVGCATTTNPLAGWTFRPFQGYEPPPYGQNYYHLDQSIIDDYQDFIKKKGIVTAGAITGFFEDGTGQRAVEFDAFEHHEFDSWRYVLIYNKENQRIKVIRYDHRRENMGY